MTIKHFIAKLTLSPSLWRGLWEGLFLLLGSTGLMAQTDDPFGEVNYRKYADNMSVTAFVRLVTMSDGKWVPINDEALGKGTVVAAYCGDELRGKDSPIDDAGYTNIVYLDIYGDNKGDKLHFKVFIPAGSADAPTSTTSTEGYVIEVNQGLTYTSDAIIGTPDQPYYIDLPAPVITTFSTEGWGTTCLPFNAEVPDGVTVWNVTGINNGVLVKSEVTGSILPANTPVLLQIPRPGEGRLQTSLTCQWLSRVADGDITTEGSILLGTVEAKAIAPNSVLTLGVSSETSETGFWLFPETEIPANQAYIADFPADTEGASMEAGDITTGTWFVATETQQTGVYDLQGRSLGTGTVPTRLHKGIYIVKGRKRIEN